MTPNPHDTFCKELFKHPDLALAFILDHIPALRGQTIGPPEDIREEFGNLHCDWIWKLKLKRKRGRPGYIYIILEHKSSPDLKVRIQLSKYNTGLLEYLASKDRKTLQPPAIIQIVLYHGKRQWNLIEDYENNLDLGERVRSTTAPLIYINLSTLPRDKLSANPSLHAAFYTMLYGTGALGKGKKAPSMEETIKMIFKNPSIKDIVMDYLTETNKDRGDEIMAILEKMNLTEGDKIMSNNIANRWITEGMAKGEAVGMAKGKAEGIVKGKAELLIQQLQRKFGPLSQDIQQRITQATSDDIGAWGEQILDAPSLDAIFGDQPRH